MSRGDLSMERILLGAALGVGAIAAVPFTGGGSVLGAATLVGSLSGVGTGLAAVTAGIVGAAIADGLGDEADFDAYYEGYEEAKTKYATKEALEREKREHDEMMERIEAEMTEDEWGPAL